MNDKNTSRTSPFYVEYTGKTKANGKWIKTYGYHVKEDFEKPLKEFFNARFGGLSDGAIMEQIVYDYYFRYAHIQQSYGKTIIALFPKDELASENPQIFRMFVLDRLAIDSENNLLSEDMIANNPILEHMAFIKSFSDCSADVKKGIFDELLNIGYEHDGYDVLKRIKHLDEDSLNDTFVVVEIPLNNHLDVKRNGVYCYENDNGDAVESVHVGLAIVKDNTADIDSPMILVYAWSLKDNFDIEVGVISRVDLDTFEELCQKYNYVMCVVLKEFKRTGLNIDFKLRENKHKQEKLQAELDVLKQEEMMFLELQERHSKKDS